MPIPGAVHDLVDESVESMELAPRNGFHLEPRCRVCRNVPVRKKVNEMLATGASYAFIAARTSVSTTPSATSGIG